MAKLVSKTYGEALFEIAVEENRIRELMEETETVRSLLKENPDFNKLMKHPGIAKQEKLQVMRECFKGRVSDELAGFLELIVTKERYGELDSIFQYFVAKVKEVSRIGVAYVDTAVELTDKQKEQVQSRLLQTTSYQTMEIHYSVNPALIGGMVIRINDRVVDSSIQTKLNALKKQLLNIQLG